MTQEVINQQIELTSQLESLTKIEQCIDELREQYVISEDEYGNILKYHQHNNIKKLL